MMTTTFPPRRFGGITGVSFSLARKLAQRGHDVTIYTTDTGNTAHARLRVENTARFDGLKVRYFRNISNRLAFKYRVYTPISCLPTLRREMSNFDIVHFHDLRSLFTIFGSYLAKRSGIPYVIQAHGSVPPEFQKKHLNRLFDLSFGRRIIKGASGLLALTQTEKEHYRAMGADVTRIDVLPNGIESAQFEKLPQQGEFRKKYELTENEQVILYVGRLHQSKGIDLLVNAFSALNRRINNTKLVIVGADDGFLRALNHQIDRLGVRDKVVLTGMVEEREKLSAYIDADVFVLPSFSGFPLTFIEACACGTPIVTTHKGDDLEWIDGNVGRVVAYDSTQLQEALAAILSDPDLRKKFSENAKQIVFNRFTWDVIVARLEEIYKVIIDKPSTV